MRNLLNSTRFRVALAAVVLPLLLQPNFVYGGPGGDSAVGSNQDMCVLPPFLNVAITERPNIMVLYDNSASMSLQAYSRPYNPDNHYYGLFNPDTCYGDNALIFRKDPRFPQEVIDPGSGVGPSYWNPALEHPGNAPQSAGGKIDNDIHRQHNVLHHFCENSTYPFSGNFLNWLSMRRVDLLRKAFTGGNSGGGAGNRNASSLVGEDDFAPCYNKSYQVPPFYGNLPTASSTTEYFVVPKSIGSTVLARVRDGEFTLGHGCPVGTAVVAGLEDGAIQQASQYTSITDGYILRGLDARVVDVKRPATWAEILRNKYASLFNIMTDAGLSTVAQVGIYPDLQINWMTVEDTSNIAISSGITGSTVVVEAQLANIGAADFTGNADGFQVYLSPDATVDNSDAPVGSCALPFIPMTGGTATVTCTLTIPNTLSESAFNEPNSRLGLLLNPGNSPAESSLANNNESVAFELVSWKPDPGIVSFLAVPDGSGGINLDFEIKNFGTATPNFNIRVYWFGWSSLGSTSETITTSSCVTPPSPVGNVTNTFSMNRGERDVFDCNFTPNHFQSGFTYETYVYISGISNEADYSNNWAYSIVKKPALGTSEVGLAGFSAPSFVLAGEIYKVNYTAINNGSSTANGVSFEMTLGFYDQAWRPGQYSTTKVTCSLGTVSGGSTKSDSCSYAVPSTFSAGYVYTSLNLIYTDLDPSNQWGWDNWGVGKLTTACASPADCTYDIEVDFFGLRRVGVLWLFNKKEYPTGQYAPANLGFTKFSDWRTDGTGLCNGGGCTANEFAGIEEGQNPANNIVPALEKADPDLQRSGLAQQLLNVIKYYQSVSNFKKADNPLLFDVDSNKDGKPHSCRRNYVLFVTDGMSWDDDRELAPDASGPANYSNIEPGGSGAAGDLRDYGSDMSDPTELVEMLDTTTYSSRYIPNSSKMPDTVDDGSYHLDNVALYGNVNDLQKDTPVTKDTVQTIIVHAFADGGTDTTNYARSRRLLRRAAINGSYTERDIIAGPSSEKEWDANGDGEPDGYFQAKEGEDLGQVVLNAINSILLKTASGTSVSVIASTARGEGAIYQSYFRPTTAVNGLEVSWLGFLQALWVDSYGNQREDTVNDGALTLKEDRIVVFDFNTQSNETFAYFSPDANADGAPDADANGNGEPDAGETGWDGPLPLTAMMPIFESGKLLHVRDSKTRNIYTWAHNATDVVPAPGDFPVSLTDSAVDACGVGEPCLKKRLWDSVNYDDSAMSKALVRWIRGDDQADNTFRKRTMEVDGQLGTWKLGDIVYSTPTIVGAPEERYDLLYGSWQDGYGDFFTMNTNRRRLILVGANDGMLHAFNGGVFRSGDNPSTGSKVESAWYDPQGTPLGEELWAYIPGSLLQNMRMLADAGYNTTCHIAYIDLKPKVTDVQIFFDSTGKPLDGHINGWGTIMIGGMRLGCGRPEFAAYFVLDITNPMKPNLLAEFGDKSVVKSLPIPIPGGGGSVTSLDGLDFAHFYPTVMRVKDDSITAEDQNAADIEPGRWFMVVGSGPDSLDFTTTKPQSYVYSFDLTKLGTGSATWLEDFTSAITHIDRAGSSIPIPSHTVVSNGITGDLNADFSVDVAYLSTQRDDALFAGNTLQQRWTGAIWRLNTNDDPDPTNWKLTELFSTKDGRFQAITASPSLTRDPFNNIRLYFGTGRFMYKDSPNDRIDDTKYGNVVASPVIPITDVDFQQSLFGIIDRCWDPTQICGVTLPLKTTNLINVSNFVTSLDENRVASINTFGGVPNCTPVDECSPSEVADHIRTTSEGWYRDLEGAGTAWEMSFNKPAVAGGIVLFTTYVPSNLTESCTLGGSAYLYGFDYLTGTAPELDLFNNFVSGTTGKQALDAKKSIGTEAPSPPAIFGKQVYVQGSNAKVTGIKTNAQFKLSPHIRGWQEY